MRQATRAPAAPRPVAPDRDALTTAADPSTILGLPAGTPESKPRHTSPGCRTGVGDGRVETCAGQCRRIIAGAWIDRGRARAHARRRHRPVSQRQLSHEREPRAPGLHRCRRARRHDRADLPDQPRWRGLHREEPDASGVESVARPDAAVYQHLQQWWRRGRHGPGHPGRAEGARRLRRHGVRPPGHPAPAGGRQGHLERRRRLVRHAGAGVVHPGAELRPGRRQQSGRGPAPVRRGPGRAGRHQGGRQPPLGPRQPPQRRRHRPDRHRRWHRAGGPRQQLDLGRRSVPVRWGVRDPHQPQ